MVKRINHNFALSPTVPTLSFSAYLSRTCLLWYFQKALVESFPAMRFRILGPPGCSSMKSFCVC